MLHAGQDMVATRDPLAPLKIWFPNFAGPVKSLAHPSPWHQGDVALLNPALQMEHPETDEALARKLVVIAGCRADAWGVRTLMPMGDAARLKQLGVMKQLFAMQRPDQRVSEIPILPVVTIERRSDWTRYKSMQRALCGGPMAVLVRPMEPISLDVKPKDLPSWVIVLGQIGETSLPCRPEWIDKLVEDSHERGTPVMVLEGGQGDWVSRMAHNAREDVPRVRLTYCGCNSSSDIPIHGVRGGYTLKDHVCGSGSDSWVQKSGWQDVPRQQDWPMEFPKGWGGGQ